MMEVSTLRLFAEVAVAMLEQPEDQKLEARLVLVAKDVLGPRKPSERLCASEQRGGQSGCVAAQPWREMRDELTSSAADGLVILFSSSLHL